MDLKSEIEEFIEKDTGSKLESLVSSLIKQKKEMTALKAENPSLFDEMLQKIVEAVKDPEGGEFDKLITSMSALLTDDPTMFKDTIYQLVIDCMMREEKSSSGMESYEQFLKIVIKIFAKDATQFVKKLLEALNKKFDKFLIPKKRKRKNKVDAEENLKKLKMTDGSIITSSSYISNIWPQSTIALFDDIITRLNVSQVLSCAMLLTLEKAKVSLTENELFKIDFIVVFLCQMFNCCRIHEHLIYKKSEISSAIRDFNQVQHEFYEVIFNTEHNNRIMSAFLRISYDYENFLMLFFYHHDPEEEKSELDSVFLTDQSRIKSSEWKIIQQRIRNFGKSEEKNYSNLRHVQQIIKSKIFDGEMEIEEDFISNILSDNEQMDLIMRQKDARATVLGLLKENEHFSLFVEYLCSHVVDDKDISVILSFLTEPESIDTFIEEILKSDDNQKIVKLLKILPLSAISSENKKKVFKKILEAASDDDLQDSLISIFLKLLKNDAYKNALLDFTLTKIVKKLSDFTKFAAVYETMFKQNLKRINLEMIQKFQWIITEGGEKLFQIFAKTFTEVNFRNASIPKENFNAFKIEIVAKLSSMIDEKNVVSQESVFLIFSKLCLQNMEIVGEEVKKHHMKLLNNFIKSSASSEHSTELFKMILRDAKKLNLNDEIKNRIVKVLLKHLNEWIEKNVKEEEKSDRIDTERELITLLNSVKPGCKLECSKFMQKLVTESKDISIPQLNYCFRIYQVLFEHSEKQNNRELIKSYMNFFDTSILQRENVKDTNLLCTIFNAHNEMIKTNKEHVDNVAMDKIFMFLIDSDNRPSSESVDDFCKFYEAVGQFLYLVGNFQHHYFKARQPQYFKVYQNILEDVYFYQRESGDDEVSEMSPKEILMLQRLSLQLENILKMLMKYHGSSFGVIIPYIISPIVNVYMKNPKLLTLNDKFKLNIKNICLQLLGAIDDRARKHIFAVVDEPTRDVYSQLFSELKMKK